MTFLDTVCVVQSVVTS